MELVTGCLAVATIFSILQLLLSSYKRNADVFFAKKNKKSEYGEIDERLQGELVQLEDTTDSGLSTYKDYINSLIIQMYLSNIVYVIFCFVVLIADHLSNNNSSYVPFLVATCVITLIFLIIYFIFHILRAEFELRSILKNVYKTALKNSKKDNDIQKVDLE